MSSIARWIGMAAVVALQTQAAEPWKHITQKDQPLLPGDDIQMIKLGPEKGQIWIGTLTGAAKIEDGVLRPVKAAKDLKVWDVTQRPEGGFWIGHGGGALLVDGDRTVATLGGQTVGSIRMVGTQLWAIAKNEATDHNTLMQANGEDWAPVAAFKNRNVLDLVLDAKGTFWLVIDGDGVVEIDPGKGLSEARAQLPRMNVTGLLTDSKGNIWCGLMAGGVMVRQGGEWKRHLDRENSAVLSLLEDDTGKIWAATSGNGLQVFDGKEWKGKLQDEGQVSLMKLTSDKRIWVSTQRRGGLRCWDGKEWKISLESHGPIQHLVELPKGVLMAGSVLDGLYILGDYNIKGEVNSDGKH